MSVPEILTLISAGTAAIVTIIQALKAKSQRQTLDLNTALTTQTRDTAAKIQTLVNGQSEALKLAIEGTQAQLAQRNARIAVLEADLARLRAGDPSVPRG